MSEITTAFDTTDKTTPERIFVVAKNAISHPELIAKKRLDFAEQSGEFKPFFDVKVKAGRRVIATHKDLVPSELEKILDAQNAQAIRLAGIAALQTASDGRAEFDLDKLVSNEMKMAVGGANAGQPIIPDSIKQSFILKGSTFFYKNNPEHAAFSDGGNKLRALDVSAATSLALVDIAQARGWESITVTGTQEFRRLVWSHAARAGIDVIGFAPEKKDFDLSGIKSPEQESYTPSPEAPAATPSPGSTSNTPKSSSNEPLRVQGILVQHGWQNYKNNPDADMSYRIVLDDNGTKHELWGVALATIMKTGDYQRGDVMAISKTGSKSISQGEGDQGTSVRRNTYAAEMIAKAQPQAADALQATQQAMDRMRNSLASTTPTAAIKVEAAAQRVIDNAISEGKRVVVEPNAPRKSASRQR